VATIRNHSQEWRHRGFYAPRIGAMSPARRVEPGRSSACLNAAQGGGDFAGGESAVGDLIQERLKEVKIAAIASVR